MDDKIKTTWQNNYFEKGLVSVIMLTHVHTNVLFSAIECYLSQTYDKTELILLDSGSTPHFDAVHNYLLKIDHEKARNIHHIMIDPYNKCLSVEKGSRNKNIASVGLLRNFAMTLAKGEYILFFDDDDLMSDDRIELQLKNLLATECDFNTLSIFTLFGESGRREVSVENGLDGTVLLKNDLKFGSKILFPDNVKTDEYSDFFYQIQTIGYKKSVFDCERSDIFTLRKTGINLNNEMFFYNIVNNSEITKIQEEDRKKRTFLYETNKKILSL